MDMVVSSYLPAMSILNADGHTNTLGVEILFENGVGCRLLAAKVQSEAISLLPTGGFS